MNDLLNSIQKTLGNRLGFTITNFVAEQEGKAYSACSFLLNNKKVFCRVSKVTPKKKGQFVTFYQRNNNEIIEPFNENTHVDYFMVFHQEIKSVFVFPKSILVKKSVLSTDKKEGKRAFRVYAPTDELISKQALATQKWQTKYFYSLKSIPDKKRMKAVFE